MTDEGQSVKCNQKVDANSNPPSTGALPKLNIGGVLVQYLILVLQPYRPRARGYLGCVPRFMITATPSLLI
jgi:hypothetical protein